MVTFFDDFDEQDVSRHDEFIFNLHMKVLGEPFMNVIPPPPKYS